METAQLEKLRNRMVRDEDLQTISQYYLEHKATYTSLSVRGVVNGLKEAGTPVGLTKAREFLTALVECGVGKGVKDDDGKLSNVTKMVLNTREIGEAVVGDSKNLRRFHADRKSRNIEGAADAVRASPQELKIYPMRKASNISITVTINGKPVILPLPDDLSSDQLSALIERLKRVEDGYDPRKR